MEYRRGRGPLSSRLSGLFGHRSATGAGDDEDAPSRLPAPGRTLALVAGALVLILVIALVATGGSSPTTRTSGTSTSLSATVTTGVSPTLPLPVLPTVTLRTPSTTAPKKATPTTAAADVPCTQGDLVITTKTDANSYGPGQVVTVTTQVTDLVACNFIPATAGPYHCSSTITVLDSSSQQVWPAPNESEQCATLTPGQLEPGSTETVTAQWNQQVSGSNGLEQAPAGNYFAVGSWAWTGTNNSTVHLEGSHTFALTS